MNSYKMTSRYLTYLIMVCVVTVLFILSHSVSAFVLSERSIQLSSSSVSTTSSYTINFTARQPASAFVVDFCTNTPLIGQICETPVGFSAESATSSNPIFGDVTGAEDRVVVAGEMIEDSEVSVLLNGMRNPSADGIVYARIVTFDTKQNALDSTPTSLIGSQDEGSVAISITPTVGVAGAVLETMTFCVSDEEIEGDCETAIAPDLVLGQTIEEGVNVLQAGVLGQDELHLQLSTNAYGGAVIHLKSTATGCGGLLLDNLITSCYIQPAQDDDIRPELNQARFGVKTTASTATPQRTATGVLKPVEGSYYNNDQFALRFTEGDNPTTGVTSASGDPFLDTGGAPASNQNMRIIFGATINNDTPAGTYTTGINLITTGRF